MDAAHEIFQRPFKVTLELEEIDTPKNYARYSTGDDLPPKMKAWRVHPDKLAEKNYGLVSDGYGFEDSPDCERISSGVNSKGPDAVALGRQGNWFLWGFCAPPAEMTESARRAFLNAIVYMKKFDGQRAIITEPTRSRRWSYVYANLLGDDEELRKYAKASFSAQILEATGGDAPKVRAYLKQHEGWLRWEQYEEPPEAGSDSRPSVRKRVAVDQDAQALGIANRDPALLDRCVEMLAKGDKPDVAARILERYTDQKHGTDAAAWRKWLDANRSRLYFTDTGGYRFRVKDEAAAGKAAKE